MVKTSAKTLVKTSALPGEQCSYIRFQASIPRLENTEPVHEFKLASKDTKYKVDEMSREGDTVYWRMGDLVQQTPWVNVVLTRPIREVT